MLITSRLYFLKNGIILFVRSSNFLTLNLEESLCSLTWPQSKYFIKLIKNCEYLECWTIANSNWTIKPVEYALDLATETWKHPSAEVKPTNQFGFSIVWSFTNGLCTIIRLGKAENSQGERPQLFCYFIPTILFKVLL